MCQGYSTCLVYSLSFNSHTNILGTQVHFITEILGSEGRRRWLLCLSLKKRIFFFQRGVGGVGILVFVILFLILLCFHNQLFSSKKNEPEVYHPAVGLKIPPLHLFVLTP